MKGKMIMIMLAVLIMAASTVLGLPDNATVSAGTTDSYQAGTAAGQDTASGGDVTNLDVSSESSTTRWQGYFGNVSMSLILGYGSDTFYDFGSGSSVNTVWASTDNNFAWGTVAAIADPATLNTDFNFPAGVIDNATAVYAGLFDPDGALGNTVATQTEGTFNTFAVSDGGSGATDNYAFGADVIMAGQACSASSSFGHCQYELLVPETNGAGDTVYFFYLEIV